MEGPFEGVFDGLWPPADAIVADTYLPWAVAVGSRRRIPVWSLFPMSATFFSVLYHSDRVPTPPAEVRDGHVTGSAAAGESVFYLYFICFGFVLRVTRCAPHDFLVSLTFGLSGKKKTWGASINSNSVWEKAAAVFAMGAGWVREEVGPNDRIGG